MPSFAPVVPLVVAEKLQASGIYGRYHLLLAHDVAALENIAGYATLFNKVEPSTIIMDNSVVELGHPVPIETMIEACKAIIGTRYISHRIVVVLPDHMLDGPATADSTRSALAEWAPAFQKEFIDVDFMAVPQGEDITTWVKCLEAFSEIEGITWIGIPRNFREKLTGSRVQACQLAHILNTNWKLHLLGFSDDLHDDIITCSMAKSLGWNLKGIDSTVPIRIALKMATPISFSQSTHTPRGDWWDKPGNLEDGWKNVEESLHRIRRWIS